MSIADKLTYLQTTKQLLKTEINKINNVLDDNSTFRSYPQELFNGYLDVLNNGTDTLWSNLEKVSQTGTEAVLEGVETAPIKMVLNGNTSQDGEPTPDYPSEVKVVTGENTIKVAGKNLFDISTITKNKTINLDTGKVNVDTNDRDTSDFILVTNSVTYSCNITMTRVAYYDENKNFLSSLTSKTSIVTPNNCKYVRFSYDNTLTNIQFERGLSTEFTPYAKTYPISLGTIEMCKIGDYKDFPFKAINGDEYYDTLTEEQKNALNYGSWYVHKEIGKKVVDENSSVAAYSVPRFRVYVANFVSPSATEKADILCDKLRTVTKNALASTDNVISGSDSGRTGEMLVRINAEINTLELFKQFLAEHNLTIYYLLATPTEEEITDTTLIEQLEAISKAKSVKDKTYITQTNDDLPFILDVQAIKEYEVV